MGENNNMNQEDILHQPPHDVTYLDLSTGSGCKSLGGNNVDGFIYNAY